MGRVVCAGEEGVSFPLFLGAFPVSRRRKAENEPDDFADLPEVDFELSGAACE